jgi:hypothetical protein
MAFLRRPPGNNLVDPNGEGDEGLPPPGEEYPRPDPDTGGGNPVPEEESGGFGSAVPPPYGGSSSPVFNFRPVPRFTPPAFQRPTLEQAMAEPGYQFRLQGGSDSLERSAAARGTLRTGGTLRDLVDYGQNFAAQEYSNVFNRALNVYDREYQGARDAFAPQYGEWQFLSASERTRALAQFQREWDMYMFGNTSAAQRESILADILNQ